MLTLLANAHVHAPDDLGRRHLLVAGGRIVWIGPADADDEPPVVSALDAERVDLEGRRLIPGLIDPHVHLTGGGGEAGAASRVPPLRLGQLTSAGITGAVGLLGTDDLTRSPRELLATVHGLVELGFPAWCWIGGYHVPPVTVTGSVRGDIVLLERALGVGELAISDHRSSQPTLDELVRIAGDAHVAGLMTGKAGVLHLHVGDGTRGLELVRRALDTTEIPPRTFHPTHVNRRRALLHEAVELAHRGCVVDVTAFPADPAAGNGAEDEVGAAEALLELLGSGIDPSRVTVSSDGGGCLPCFDAEGRVASFEVGSPASMAGVLTDLLHRGERLPRILPAFTTNAARLLRLAGRGAIAVGAAADLVVLGGTGDPRPHAARDVMIGGRWHRRADRQLLVDRFEALPPTDDRHPPNDRNTPS